MPGEDRGTATRAPWSGWLAATLAVTPLLRWLVLVHAVPPDQPWRHACPYCAAPLGPGAGLTPLRPAGRCGNCRRRIGAPPYAVEVVTVLAAALVVLACLGRSPGEAVAFALWAAVAVVLAFVDVAQHRLPDRLTLPAAAGVLALLGVAAATGADGSWLRTLLAAAACAAGFVLVTLLAGERAFGLGDAKLALSVGALLGWVGWSVLLGGLFLAFLGSGIVALVLLVTRRAGRRDMLPFGPFLVGGTLVTLALT